jgi:Aromatic-ring-opening dioxygenase LigAB, LigA subunit
VALYTLQKLIRDVDTKDDVRRAYFAAPAEVIARYELDPEEKTALLNQDFSALYRMGVHGLLLRPFSILHAVSEPDYLAAIRGRAS